MFRLRWTSAAGALAMVGAACAAGRDPVGPAPLSAVTFTFCDTQSPIWFAARDTSGVWMRVQGVNNVFVFPVGETGAVAWEWSFPSGRAAEPQVAARLLSPDALRPPADAFHAASASAAMAQHNVSIFHGTREDIARLGSGPCEVVNNRSASGFVIPQGTLDRLTVTLGGRSPTADPTPSLPSFLIRNIPPGSIDLWGGRWVPVAGTPGEYTLEKFFLRRGIDPADGALLGPIDFAHPTEAFDPELLFVTLAGGAPGDTPAIIGQLASTGGSLALGTFDGAARMVYAAPGSRLRPGDLHTFFGRAHTGSFPDFSIRWTSTTRRAFGRSLQMNLGPPFPTPLITRVPTDHQARLRVQAPRLAEYDKWWSVSLVQVHAQVSMTVTGGYLGTSENVDLTMPDFSGLAGWRTEWGLLPGERTHWTLAGAGWLHGQGDAVEGQVTRSGWVSGVLVP